MAEELDGAIGQLVRAERGLQTARIEVGSRRYATQLRFNGSQLVVDDLY